MPPASSASLIIAARREPFSPAIPMACLGLGPRSPLQATRQAAGAPTTSLFDLWKGADPDLPVLQQARTDAARNK